MLYTLKLINIEKITISMKNYGHCKIDNMGCEKNWKLPDRGIWSLEMKIDTLHFQNSCVGLQWTGQLKFQKF